MVPESGPVIRLTFDLKFNWGDPHPNKAKKLGVSARAQRQKLGVSAAPQ